VLEKSLKTNDICNSSKAASQRRREKGMADSKRATQHLPSCENCDFFRRMSDEERLCNRHDFVMPRVDWQILCQDWQHKGSQVDWTDLKPGTLYYYSSSAGMRAEIGQFKNLQRIIFSVSIRQDEAMGWVIFPRRYYNYFPAPDRMVTILIGERRCKFQVVNVERNVATEMIPRDEGQWDTQTHTQQVLLLTSLESPDLLRDWLSSIMNVGAYIEDSFAPSLFAFIEVKRPFAEYALHADMLAYQKYSR
jgi:hypothetical protein